MHQVGVLGNRLYQLARGIDDRPVESEKITKSIGHEITFDKDIDNEDILKMTLLNLAIDIGRRLRMEEYKAKTVTIKVRHADFRTISRSHTLSQATDLDDVIYQEACKLLKEISLTQPFRLIGITLNNLEGKSDYQLSFFDDSQKDMENLIEAIDKVNKKYGKML